MRFDQYLELKGISYVEAERQLGYDYERIRRWANREALPRERGVVDIYIWTDGLVAPNDWYNLPELHVRSSERSVSSRCDDRVAA